MLGPRQKEMLSRFAKSFDEPVTITIKALPYRGYTRELGSGHDVMVSMMYDTDGETDLSSWISTCKTVRTANAKVDEIRNHLAPLVNDNVTLHSIYVR